MANFLTINKEFDSFYLEKLLQITNSLEFSLGGSIILSSLLVKMMFLPISLLSVIFFFLIIYETLF